VLCLAGQGSQKIFASTVDDSTPHGALHAPHDMAMAQGSLGKYLFIIPSLNVTISTLGMSDSSSLECVGDDDAFLVSFVWNAIAEAVVPNHTTTVARGPKTQTANAGSIPAAATEHMPARLFAPARPRHGSGSNTGHRARLGRGRRRRAGARACDHRRLMHMCVPPWPGLWCLLQHRPGISAAPADTAASAAAGRALAQDPGAVRAPATQLVRGDRLGHLSRDLLPRRRRRGAVQVAGGSRQGPLLR
jgi:hypothetical protein